jgi:dTDP-4-dehydrorhamnose reductase
MKILLTGASGLLGRSLFPMLRKRTDFTVLGTAFHRSESPLMKLDITDSVALKDFLGNYMPDVIIHTAAERRPDIVDTMPDQSRVLNVDATRAIAQFAARNGKFLLYISTDYVFDGVNPPYRTDSPVNPLNEYGRLKLAGELALREEYVRFAGSPCDETASLRIPAGKLGMPAAILRIPILYGPVLSLEECPVTELAQKISAGKPCTIEHWANRYPVHVDDVARAIILIVDARTNHQASYPSISIPTFQLSGTCAFTKYEMSLIMAEKLGIGTAHISPDTRPPSGAPRPKDCRMDTKELDVLGYVQRVEFANAIGGILAPFFPPHSFQGPH